jgi:Dimerisation domain
MTSPGPSHYSGPQAVLGGIMSVRLTTDLDPSPLLEARQQLDQMVTGGIVTQLVYVAAKLGIADLLRDGPRSCDDLARSTEAHAPSLYRALRALASLGVFTEVEVGHFGLTPIAAWLQSDPRLVPSDADHQG